MRRADRKRRRPSQLTASERRRSCWARVDSCGAAVQVKQVRGHSECFARRHDGDDEGSLRPQLADLALDLQALDTDE